MSVLDRFNLTGRRALVTGGSRGLGLEMARALGEAGAQVIIAGSNADHLHTATVGNPAFMPGMPTLLGGLPGFEAFASYMMKKEMDKLDIPHVKEFLEMIDAAGGEIYACKLAADMFHLTKDDLVPEVKDIITVGDMYALADGEGTHILYI